VASLFLPLLFPVELHWALIADPNDCDRQVEDPTFMLAFKGLLPETVEAACKELNEALRVPRPIALAVRANRAVGGRAHSLLLSHTVRAIAI
jgi:hypothetical protein